MRILITLLSILPFGVLMAAEGDPPVLPSPSDPVVLTSDEANAKAGTLAIDDRRAEATLVLEDHIRRNPEDVVALQQYLALRVASLEAEIRAILTRDAATANLAVAPKLDYEAIKAKAEEQIRRRLVVAEYFEARIRLGEAIEACDAILKDHPGHPAVMTKKMELLASLEKAAWRDRKGLERENDVRTIEVINEVVEKLIMPREKPKEPRTVVVFDEDITDVERERVRQRLKERVSLENNANADVRTVIEALFAIAGINYVILDSAIPADETLTLNIIDESVEHILEIVSRQAGLRYNYIAGTVYISSATAAVLETEIIRLQSGLTDVMIKPKLEGTSGQGGGGQGGQPALPDPFALNQQQGDEEDSSDLERFIAEIPNIVVGWPAEGTIYLDRKSNSLFVKSTPAGISEVKRLLQAIDYNTVQVLIEARFVLVSETAGFELGIDWAGRTNGTANGNAIGIEGGTNTNGGSVNNPLGTPPSSGSLPQGMLVSGLLGDLGGEFLGATLRALETKGKAQALAEPKILTLNNATGVLALENDIAYVESYTTESQQTSANQGNNGNVVTTSSVVLRPQLQTEKEEISLKVQPSVARNSDVITLRLQPRVRQLTQLREVPFQYQPSPDSDLITVSVERPQFDDRKLETVLHIQNGQTIALGGLVRATEQDSTTGLPWVSRVPLLGRLFRSDSKNTDRRNLVIFVTAYIIEPNGAKVGDDIQFLRDNARMALPAAVREEILQRARGEADKKAASEGGQPAWMKGRGR